MAVDLASPRYFIDHAKRRIQEFEGELVRYLSPPPYETVGEVDPNGRECHVKVKLTRPLPEMIPGIVFDAVNALRSALDQTGYACAVADGRSGSKAKFPFGDSITEVQWRRHGKGSSKQLPKEIFDLMVSFQPYKGGNGPLWGLNNLCNAQKHNAIVRCEIVGEVIKGEIKYGLRPQIPERFRWDSAKQELRLFTHLVGDNPQAEFHIFGRVSLGEIAGWGAMPADKALHGYVGLVTKIIGTIEAKAVEIGL